MGLFWNIDLFKKAVDSNEIIIVKATDFDGKKIQMVVEF